MKRVDLTKLGDAAFEEALDEYPGFCESKDDPEEVLEEVDRLLSDFGLEVVIAEDGDDAVLFTVVKKKKGVKR